MARSVKQYGAIGDGIADDTAAFTVAFRSGREVTIPTGTYRITGTVLVTSGTKILGEGSGSHIVADPGFVGTTVIRLVGATCNNVVLRDFRMSMGNLDKLAVQIGNTGVVTNNTLVENLIVTGTAGVGEGIRATWTTNNLEISSCRVRGFRKGININCGNGGSTGIKIHHNRIDTCSVYGIQLVHADGQSDVYFDVSINDNTVLGMDGDIAPIEPSGCTDIRIFRNFVAGGSRGISTANLRDFKIYENHIVNQTIYSFELNAARDGAIYNNHSRNTNQLVSFSAAAFGMHDNVRITGNTITDCVLGENSSLITMAVAPTTNIQIDNNVFNDITSPFSSACILHTGNNASNSNILFEKNTYFASRPDSIVRLVNALWADQVKVYDNTVIVTRDTPSRDDSVVKTNTGSSAPGSVNIEQNQFYFLGARGAGFTLYNTPPTVEARSNKMLGGVDWLGIDDKINVPDKP